MCLTSPVSWPISWLLRKIFGKGEQNNSGIFSNTQLEALILYHDETEKKGGHLGPDAARVAIGAMKLNSQTIGAETMRAISPDPEKGDMDVEKAEVIVSHGMIVKWSAVKTIKIDDLVDLAFLKKVKGWTYSRIPVISKAEIGPWVGDEKNLQGGMEDWDGTRIYGFLHTRVSHTLFAVLPLQLMVCRHPVLRYRFCLLSFSQVIEWSQQLIRDIELGGTSTQIWTQSQGSSPFSYADCARIYVGV